MNSVIDGAESRLEGFGFKIFRENFAVTVPEERTPTTLKAGDRSFRLQPLWPNLVRTSRCNLQGPIVFGGRGSLDELSGKKIEGSIVVLDFDSGAAWTNAAMLKCAAVVFIAGPSVFRLQAEEKFKGSPLDVPRFLLLASDASAVKSLSGTTARLQCEQDWISRIGTNLIADLPGADSALADQPIVLFTYADSMSVTPGQAPGGEQACGLAVTLELARLQATNKPKRPLRIVISSAHCLALQGAREYVEARFVKPEETPLLVATIDLSSSSSALGIFGRGYDYGYRDEALKPVQPFARKMREHAEDLVSLLGAASPRVVLTDAVNHTDNRTWRNNIAAKFGFDCEPFVSAGYASVTFATIDDARSGIDTPTDTFDKVNVANLTRQAVVLNVLLHHVLNDPLGKVEKDAIPLDPSRPSRLSLIGGFGTGSGYVAVFDPTRSLVPDLRIEGSLAVHIPGKKTLMGVRGNEVQLTTGPEAAYKFIGLPPVSSFSEREKPPTVFLAYHLDPVTGKIDHAPDDGPFGSDSYPYFFDLKVSQRSSPIVVFPCKATNIFGLVDPQDLTPMLNTEIVDPNGGARPNSYGFARSYFDLASASEVDDTGVIFTKENQKIQLLAGSMSETMRMLLLNATSTDEEGKGYTPDGNSMGDLSLLTAADICAVNQSRINRFAKYRMLPASVVETHREALAELDLGKTANAEQQWGAAQQHARAAWSLALRIHPTLKQTANDVVNGVIFYSFLLIPFSFFLERLLFASRALTKQLLLGSAIFVGSFVLLRLIHPAFDIVSNPAMIFVGFVMGSLSLLVMTFILGKFESALREVKQSQSGVREIDVRRGNVASAAISLGISNLRRRKARTLLTTLTLVVMTFIVLSFSSIVPEFQLSENPSPNKATYAGILLRDPGLEPLKNTSYLAMANEFRDHGYLARRVYSYGADRLEGATMSLEREGKFADASAMQGLDAAESLLTKPQAALTSGSWFDKDAKEEIILPAPLAEKLAAKVGDKVTFMGSRLTLRGIFDPEKMRAVRDLDGESIMPPDFTLSKKEQGYNNSQTRAFRPFVRLDPAVCFILPAQTALALGGDLRTIGVGFDTPKKSHEALQKLMPRLRLNLYGTAPTPTGSEVRRFSLLQGSKTSGLGLILVQLFIASIFVLNTMIASVYERTKEISIFSAIGLSPNHIATLFFAESAVYGVLGSVIGYFAAQGAAKLLIVTGAFPALTLNFSSTSAILATGLVLAVVMGSSIYPARKAAQIAAPAMAESNLETEPEGDNWVIQLPFSVPQEEAMPIVRFLYEWLRGHEEYAIGDFVTADTELLGTEAKATAWIAPFDLGVSQELTLRTSASPISGAWIIELHLNRLSGEPGNWQKVNKRFLSALRRQFLRWRTLTADERVKFGA